MFLSFFSHLGVEDPACAHSDEYSGLLTKVGSCGGGNGNGKAADLKTEVENGNEKKEKVILQIGHRKGYPHSPLDGGRWHPVGPPFTVDIRPMPCVALKRCYGRKCSPYPSCLPAATSVPAYKRVSSCGSAGWLRPAIACSRLHLYGHWTNWLVLLVVLVAQLDKCTVQTASGPCTCSAVSTALNKVALTVLPGNAML